MESIIVPLIFIPCYILVFILLIVGFIYNSPESRRKREAKQEVLYRKRLMAEILKTQNLNTIENLYEIVKMNSYQKYPLFGITILNEETFIADHLTKED